MQIGPSERLHEAGRSVGSAQVQELARLANRFTPELRTHDRFGNRIDQIAFHPAWHELMGLAIGQETHALAWNQPQPGAQVARAALTYLWTQGESGICCPISMTYSAIPAAQAGCGALGGMGRARLVQPLRSRGRDRPRARRARPSARR